MSTDSDRDSDRDRDSKRGGGGGGGQTDRQTDRDRAGDRDIAEKSTYSEPTQLRQPVTFQIRSPKEDSLEIPAHYIWNNFSLQGTTIYAYFIKFYID